MFNNLQNQGLSSLVRGVRVQRGLAFGVIILTALLFFEIFNYSTTEFALSDLLGDLKFMGIHWATILAVAFCGIDFAGIARLFTPGERNTETNEVWYLFGAWLLAATMNAMLTWWGVSLAILGHETLGSAVIEREKLLHIVPVFVAVLVWLIRVLIIGTFSVAGNHLFSQGENETRLRRRPSQREVVPQTTVQPPTNRAPVTRPTASPVFRNAPKPAERTAASTVRAEPTYHPISGVINTSIPKVRMQGKR